jgi:DNA-directed RNA polymerase specialized sigma subunit
MKQIGQEIGVNESRVSQLHARAVARLRKALSPAAAVVPFPKSAVA